MDLHITETGQRRRHQRYKVKGGTVGVARSQFMKMGQINDISKGGLSFRYFAEEDDPGEIPHTAELSISLEDINFHIERIPFITRSDFKVEPDFVEMRHRCVQFGHISQSQQVHIDYFISNLVDK